MNKKITMINLDLSIDTGTILYVTIDDLKFSADEDQVTIIVEMENNGSYEFIDEIYLPEDALVLQGHDDLKRYALNWVFENVEIVKGF